MTRAALAVLLFAGAVGADEVAEAADAVIAALGDPAALGVLAARDEPDPWHVAAELCARKRFDAANAFARAKPRPATKRLPAFVAARKARPTDPAVRESEAAVFEALNARQWQAALDAAKDDAWLDTVAGIRIRAGMGYAHHRLGDNSASFTAFYTAARAAAELGWVVRAGDCFHLASVRAYRLSNWDLFQQCCRARVEIERQLAQPARLARALHNLGTAYDKQDRYDAALEAHAEALEIRRKLGDDAGVATSLTALGALAHAWERHAEAADRFEEALAVRRRLGDKQELARALNNLGAIYQELGDPATALRYCRESLELRRGQDPAGTAATLNNLGALHEALGEYAPALARYEEALKLSDEAKDVRGRARTLHNLGLLHRRFGQHAKALARLEEALALKRKLDDRPGVLLTLNSIGLAHKGLGDLDQAEARYTEALTLARDSKWVTALVHNNLGILRSTAGDFEAAQAHYTAALEYYTAVGDTMRRAACHTNLGLALVRQEKFNEGEAEYARAIALLRDAPSPEARLHVVWSLAALRLKRGDPDLSLIHI